MNYNEFDIDLENKLRAEHEADRKQAIAEIEEWENGLNMEIEGTVKVTINGEDELFRFSSPTIDMAIEELGSIERAINKKL